MLINNHASWYSWPVSMAALVLVLFWSGTVNAAPGGPAEKLDPPPVSDSPVTTESNCSFGMEKGTTAQGCQVPIPAGCVVAHFPGTTKPWTNISKGGNTQCRFDDKKSDWKTRITGTCERCKSGHCSVQFVVKFNCAKG